MKYVLLELFQLKLPVALPQILSEANIEFVCDV